jgi:alpha-L-arabinofuranosidase
MFPMTILPGRRLLRRWLPLCALLLWAGCAADRAPRYQPAASAPTDARPAASPAAPSAAASAAASPASAADLLIDVAAAGAPFDPRLRGTNTPAWMHVGDRPTFDNPTFQRRTAAAGVTVLRMPGGSWSNSYDWLACETANAERASPNGCNWTWAARPSDFIRLMRTSGQPGMWAVSMEGTPEEAAALVAFFNGDVADQRPIGIDLTGRDWLTVGHWASLRSANGSPQPQPILLWEVGNEIYGAKQSTGGPNCAAFGWEEVWTCDGDEYVRGRDQHQGFVAFSTAMKRIDPQISVGAVGVDQQSGWGDWGNKVIAGAGQVMDFYVIHHYAFGVQESDYAAILAKPQQTWPAVMDDVRAAFARHADGRQVPVAITEYNIFAFRDLDAAALMRRAVNALYIADTIGQMAQSGVAMANQFDLANGLPEGDTSDVYGMLQGTSMARTPQYYALPLWARFGAQLLPLRSSFDAATTLSAYAGRADDGQITLLAINKTGKPIDASIALSSGAAPLGGTVDVLQADSLDATTVRLNGVADPADDLSDAPAQPLAIGPGPLRHSFPPYSITLLRLRLP